MRALAESTIVLFKTEAVSKCSQLLHGPIRTIHFHDIEFATMEWWIGFNTHRLHCTLDYVIPDEFEAVHYSKPSILQPEMSPAWERQESRHGSGEPARNLTED